MSVRTTNAVQRLDVMLAQAERFLAMGLRGEAVARARQVLVHADRELEEECRTAVEAAPVNHEAQVRNVPTSCPPIRAYCRGGLAVGLRAAITPHSRRNTSGPLDA